MLLKMDSNIGKPEHGSFENLTSVLGIHWFFFFFLNFPPTRSLSQGLPSPGHCGTKDLGLLHWKLSLIQMVFPPTCSCLLWLLSCHILTNWGRQRKCPKGSLCQLPSKVYLKLIHLEQMPGFQSKYGEKGIWLELYLEKQYKNFKYKLSLFFD